MDAEGTARERALEDRIAHLEERLRRLEGAVGLDPQARAEAVVTSPFAAPTAPPAWPDTRRSTVILPVPQPSGAETHVPAPPAAPPAAVSGPEVTSGWDTTVPPFRMPSSIKLPDLSGSLNDLESRLAGRALAWVGGLALVLGAIFFLSLAFSRGWIGPELRVLIGLVAGSICLAGGAAFMERDNRLLGHALTPVGLAIISVSLIAATRLFDLVPVEVGLAVALLSAIVAAVIAVRSNSQIVAGFGLISVLAAPPLMGASPDMATLAFIAVVLVGTTGVALWRSWSWLPPVAFVLSVLQAASWINGHPDPAIGLIGIWLYWLLNIVAAGGEEFRRHRDDLSPSSATVLVANVAFLVWAGFVLLSGDLLIYRGFFLILVALAQLGIGGFFVVRDGDRNLFGLLAMATGIAALTMAAPVQLGASAVPLAWSAEAVALAWVAVRRGHPYSAVASGVLYTLAGTYLLALYDKPIASTSGVPLVDGPGAALGFFFAAAAAGIWIVRDRSLRSGLAAFGLLVTGICVSAVLGEPATVIASTVLMVLGAAGWRAIPILPGEPIVWQTEGLIPRALQRIGNWRGPIDALLPLTTTFLGLAAGIWLVGPTYGSMTLRSTGVPFADAAGGALVVYLVGLVAVAWISGRSRIREPLAASGLLVTAWACMTEFDGVALVAAWSTLMVVGIAMWRGLAALPHDPPMLLVSDGRGAVTLDLVLPFAALLSGLFAAFHILGRELPIDRFGDVLPPVVPFTDDGAVAAMILTVAVLAVGVAVGGALARRVSILVAGGVIAYAIPFEVYAWAVAVMWTGVGGLALVVARVDRAGRAAFLVASGVMVIGAAAVAVAIVAPPSRLVVGSSAIDPVSALQSAAALGAVALGLVALARSSLWEPLPRWTWAAAGVTVLYLLSVGVVDLVGTQVGGPVTTDELRTQGQVAVSVLWAGLGVVAFVAGLRFRIDDLRHGGLALLALATAKVFLFDLSALDVAYRVISLIALGLLLLASAWLWQRLQPRPTSDGGTDGAEAELPVSPGVEASTEPIQPAPGDSQA